MPFILYRYCVLRLETIQHARVFAEGMRYACEYNTKYVDSIIFNPYNAELHTYYITRL